jgi:hypothetical protein
MRAARRANWARLKAARWSAFVIMLETYGVDDARTRRFQQLYLDIALDNPYSARYAESSSTGRESMSTQTALPTSEALSSSTLHADPSLIREGMGVTMRTGPGGLYRAYSVIAVRRNGRELDIQADKVTVHGKSGWDDAAEKTYEADPNGRIETITLRNDHSFIVKGTPKEWYATRYYVGYRRDWTDYSQ